jgi:hypothetical protein
MLAVYANFKATVFLKKGFFIMSMVKAVANRFRSATTEDKGDRYSILSPLIDTVDFVSTTANMLKVFDNTVYADMMSGKVKPTNKYAESAVKAYHDYVRELSNQEQSLERARPFSTMEMALESIGGNLTLIEDNFTDLFGKLSATKPEATLRSSSLVIIGYLERADQFATWLMMFVEHMTAGDSDMIPPFRTKELLNKSHDASQFAATNLRKWNYKTGGLLSEVREMQAKGKDVSVQTQSGEWIDEIAHDDQFSADEQILMSAALRSTVMMVVTWGHVRTKNRIDLLTSRKNWLTSKIVLEQSKLRGSDPESPEYKRLKKATDHYADLVSKYEQKIERMRG